MENCIFCKIASKEIGNLIYENDYVAAFDDLNPVAPVHSLVIPKKHIANIEDINADDMFYISEIHKVIKEVAKLKGISESGYRVISNCGKDAMQSVMHLHYHVIGGKELGEKIV